MHLSDVSAQIRRVLPANLISRVRLLLLVLAGASTVTIVPIIVIGSRGGIGTQLLSGTLLAAVLWRWITWYRHRRLHRGDLLLEALAVVVVTAGFIDPVNSLAFVFAGLYYRPTYVGNRGTAVATLVYCVSFLTGVALGAPDPYRIASAEILTQIPAMILTAAMVRIIGNTLEEHAATARRLQDAEHEFRTLVEQLPGVVISADRQGAAVYVSPRIYDVLGCHPGEFLDGPSALTTRLVHPDDYGRLSAVAQASIASGEPLSVDVRVNHPDGRLLWVRYEARLVDDSTGETQFWRGIVTDITEHHSLSEKLKHQAFHDGLTGLPNRSLFEERLEHGLARQSRRACLHAVLFLDLDNFKIINDSMGHKIGDQFLITTANRICGSVRVGDTVARFGGDEFAVLIEDLDDESEAMDIVRQMTERLAEPFLVGDYPVHASASIGIAFSSDQGYRMGDLVRHADVAMYEAKRAGKGRYAIFEPEMDTRAWDRMDLETGLRRAVEQHQFRIEYQPVVDLGTGWVREVEALVRWQHPTRGLLAPGFFLALAEETGLIAAIDRWVMHHACLQVAHWQQQYPEYAHLTLSCNVSSGWLRESTLADDVAQILCLTGFRPEHLKLEVTERAMIVDVEQATSALKVLHELGVRIAIDDFGTGNSALSYFRNLPVDTLKIDRSYVADFGQSDKGTTMIHAVIGLAKSLGLSVTAEGMEVAEHLRLGELGCDLGQGYYFAKPLPVEAIGLLLAANHTYAVDHTAPTRELVSSECRWSPRARLALPVAG